MTIKTTTGGSGVSEHTFIQAEKYSHLSDTEIIDKILAGATPFFEVLMRRYNQKLFRIQRSYISDEEAIKDTLQLTYIKAFEHLGSFRREALFSTWIVRIAINEALKYLQREKRYSNLHLAGDNKTMNDYRSNTTETPEDDAIQKDLKVLLEKIIGTLPLKYRSVYMMREVEQMDTKETAECLDLSESNVKVRLHRAKQMIQQELEKRVADTEIFEFMGERCDQLVYRVMHLIQDLNRRKV